MKHVQFCGTIKGRVTVRPGETVAQAIDRAERQLNTIMFTQAKRLGFNNEGPIVSLCDVDTSIRK